MTDTTAPEAVEDPRRPRPNALTAAAARLTSKNFDRFKQKRSGSVSDSRAGEAREMYRIVGEQRFLASTIAGRIGQGLLYVGRLDPDNPTAEPERVEDDPAIRDAIAGFGRTPAQRAQLLTRAGLNLFVVGDGWFVGIPRAFASSTSSDDPPPSPLDAPGEDGIDLSDLDWHMLSTKEVDTSEEGQVKLRLDGDGADARTYHPDAILMIRFWRPDPFEWWMADSPVLASLPVLRELVGLTMHVSAQIDSRLAGAGILIVPESAKEAINRAAGVQPDGEDDDPFTDALIEAMVTPITDRSNASAYVPLVITVPDDVADKFKHISFSTPLDAEARQLRDEAIRRLALGEDAPPELLLGMATMNHWGAWLVREDVIVTHVEPPLALICDALTREYLWPALIASGRTEDEARQYVIWYSVQHLISRPDRLADAQLLHTAGVLNDSALRDAGGYDDDDAPEGRDPAIQIVMDMVTKAPSLAGDPGLPTLVNQVREVLMGLVPEVAAPGAPTTPAQDGEPADTGTPATTPATEPAPGDAVAASGALVLNYSANIPDVDGVLVNGDHA